MNEDLKVKSDRLKEYLRSLGSVVIAFSGGVDSTFLAKIAHDVLGDNMMAVTAASDIHPRREENFAKEFCEKEGIRHICIRTDELSIPGFKDNPPNRCYICKYGIFSSLKELTKKEGFAYLCEGSNVDDLKDYRPGMRAITELEVKSPLKEAGLLKSEIRILSKELGLPTWNTPAFACLASRFAYGEEITKEKLNMVEGAEELLLSMGFSQMRVRIHGKLARIEVLPNDFSKIMEEENRNRIYTELKKMGFTYVTLDLCGYRMGSMNEVLDEINK